MNLKETLNKFYLEGKKPISHKKANQERLFLIMLINFYYGLFVFATYQAFQEFFKYELWHKILVSPIGNIPIGIIGMIIVLIMCGFVSILIIGFDYFVYTKGLEFIKVKNELKDEESNSSSNVKVFHVDMGNE